MGDDPHDNFEGHEGDDEEQRDRQVAAIRIDADVVRVASIVMVVGGIVLIGVIVQLSTPTRQMMIARPYLASCSKTSRPQ
jgi:hypothetical protein